MESFNIVVSRASSVMDTLDVKRYIADYVSLYETRQSGLPLYWSDASPVPAQFSNSQQLQLSLKRGVDVVVAFLALVALAPLLIFVALAIKLTSPGKVLFRQEREGLGGNPFWTLKFRSMRTDMCDISGVAQTKSGDPRVTAIGRFIRKTSIDELPQLFNVIAGDMSLVGPRPHVAGMQAGGRLYRDLVPYYAQRLAVRPGITGWAQANGLRGSTRDAASARSRIDHDIAYCQNFSLWLDCKIILRTLHREFLGGTGV